MKVKSEYEVESLFLDRLQEMDYSYVELKNYDDVLNNFRTKLCEVNKDELIAKKGIAELSDSEFHKVMLRLNNHTIYESAKILRQKWILDLDNGETAYIEFLTNDTTRNTYQVTHQVTMDKEHESSVLNKNRYDVTVLINGLPLVQIELKRAGIEINEAINQINRYRKDSFKGLFRYIQIFIVSNSTQTKYFANANEIKPDGTRNNILKSLVFYWTDDENNRITKLIPFANAFLEKFAITDMLNKYYVIKECEPILMVMRPYQIYAVRKAFERIKTCHLSGYVFHTTGSGKTLTSFKLATLLRDDLLIDRVFFLVDRKDLDDQTVDEYNSFEKDCVDNTENTKGLVDAIKDSSKKMIITTIKKMAIAVKNPRYQKSMDTLKDKRCVFIIDECHRSQFGTMRADVERYFKNADYIGFTGTPIFSENKSKEGATTADMFKAGTLDSCIHRYMIKEAIADGNVLRFSVEYMRNINVISSSATIDVTKIDDPAYCKKNKIDINNFYHEEKRLESIAIDILKHLEQHVRPGGGKDVYTAMFAVDRVDTLLKYYDYFKANNEKGYKIAAIFHCQENEEMEAGVDETSKDKFAKCIKDYNYIFGKSYNLSTFDAYRKDIIKRMKQKDEPQIDLLLVVDMMLTGFDSKPTNLLILDKNLEWHNLLQAYSRTNRVDKTTKQFGQIVTYRNIKKQQDDALKLFSGDGDPNEFLLKSYEYHVADYGDKVGILRAICATPDDAEILIDEDMQKQYVLAFRAIANSLATLKTFSKFNQEDLDVFLDEADYYDYKSWYLEFYDHMEKTRKTGKDTILVDVDFDIELVRTDRINVVYILNLLKDINRADKEKMEQSIDLILREIERSDNEKMRYKREIMTSFINDKFFELDPEEDIIRAYEEYEKEILNTEIEVFSNEHGIDKYVVAEILTQYFCNEKSVTREKVRQRIFTLGFGLLKMDKLIDGILIFIQDMYDKFTAEGD
ncbi:type I restriction endonuclease subunit R [Clostridioides sp. ZZV14-6154]|nr:type I restriction endonuclease subunit R [Clostridioides sp. ZZV14-6154]MCC0670120.1 type I restriction endonuclease subunit R [Clostridioides sp. ZZV14-6153]MCC0739170.1 type I restriction endonuclease subunit R [Clostridioides sp. ZZV14-5902]